LLKTTFPPATNWTKIVALFAGTDFVGCPSGAWSAVTLNDPPEARSGGGVASAVMTTGEAHTFGSPTLPALKPGFGFMMRKAGEEDEEYCDM